MRFDPCLPVGRCGDPLWDDMVTLYSIHDGVLKTITDINAQTVDMLSAVWLNIQSPTERELEELKVLVDIPKEVITDVLDMNEVPKLDRIDEYLYILLQTPIATPQPDRDHPIDLEYTTAPLAMLLSDRMLITVSDESNDTMEYLKEKLENVDNNRIIDTDHLPQIVVKIFLFTAKMYLRYLKEIYHRLQIPLSQRDTLTFDKDIVDLLKVEQSLVYFDTSLRSDHIVIEKMTRRKVFTETDDDQELMDDAVDELRQAVELSQVYAHIVEDIRNALSSLISNNLTRTVNWLTKVTVILMFPTLVATLYGMNVQLPYAHSPHAFGIVVFISLTVTLLGFLWLREGRSFRNIFRRR